MTFGVQMGWRVCSLRVSEGEGFQSWGMVEWGRCTNKWVADKMLSSRSPWSWLSSLCPQWREGCFGSDMFHHFSAFMPCFFGGEICGARVTWRSVGWSAWWPIRRTYPNLKQAWKWWKWTDTLFRISEVSINKASSWILSLCQWCLECLWGLLYRAFRDKSGSLTHVELALLEQDWPIPSAWRSWKLKIRQSCFKKFRKVSGPRVPHTILLCCFGKAISLISLVVHSIFAI